jgi:hypothetical protein
VRARVEVERPTLARKPRMHARAAVPDARMWS